jgi:signal transduction histidine kinase
MDFLWGLLFGLLGTAVGGAIVAAIYYRRITRLQRRAQQAERLAELGTLTSGLAHEIKNPLSTVQLNLQLLQEDLDPGQPAHSRLINRLGTIRRETSRLKDILDDFLRFAGKLEIDRKPVELGEMLEELVDFFAPQAQLSRIQLRLKKPPEPLVAPIDVRLIKQSVLNLMINAAQAIGDRGGEIILSADRRGDEAVIDVIDTGPGMAGEVMSHIFNAYYSTKKGGTGLGLAITKRIAEEHGGRIDVKSDAGKGTDFAISLPLQSI